MSSPSLPGYDAMQLGEPLITARVEAINDDHGGLIESKPLAI